MKIVIIEDEPLTAKDLAGCIVKANPAAEITAVLPSVKEAIAYFNENDDPDLIFSDIQLGDGTSFEIFTTLQRHIPVIFCTAFDEYALEAFKATGIDYIVKPFTVKTIEGALEKFSQLKARLSTNNQPLYPDLTLAVNALKKQQQLYLLVHYKDKIIPVQTAGIAFFYLHNEITHLITLNKQQYLIDKTLEEIEKNSQGDFYRANRQFLVNRKAIQDVSQFFGRKLIINLTVPFAEKITVSKAKANHFLQWLSGC